MPLPLVLVHCYIYSSPHSKELSSQTGRNNREITWGTKTIPGHVYLKKNAFFWFSDTKHVEELAISLS